MALSGEQRKSRNIFQRATQALRYGRDLELIEEYQVGEIKSHHGVYIMAGAAVVGDIEAPKVIVGGLVYGYIQADEVIIEDGGVVWGDIYTAAFQLEQGGKLNGWVSGWVSSPEDVPLDTSPSTNGSGDESHVYLPPELEALVPDIGLLEEEEKARSERAAIWRQLQNEAAVAIMARLELEKSFGSRVDEVAGESLSESSRLRDEVSIFREERSAMQGHIEKLEETLSDEIDKFETKSAELDAVRSLLVDKDAALNELQKVFEQQSLRTTTYETTRHNLESKLAQETEKNEELVERVANLESALQGSLQHTAEQEEALIRWQELAEVTEDKASGLEDELAALLLQVKESNQVVDLLRSQRDKLEAEWETASKDLMEVAQDRAIIKADLDNKTKRLAELEKERAKLQESLDVLQQRYESQPPEYEQMVEKVEMITANNSDLKERAQHAEREAMEYQEQWLWTKASLDTTCSDLDTVRATLKEHELHIEALEGKITEQEGVVENWKNSVGRMTNLLYEAEKKAQTLKLAAAQAKAAPVESEEKSALQSEVRQQQAQIEAYEAEVSHIHEEIERQSQILADMRATLVEREISLDKSRQTADQQAAQLEHIKRMATKRIRALEADLVSTKQKLTDLSVWLERKKRREGNNS
jgi:chromosome segregation ATPase